MYIGISLLVGWSVSSLSDDNWNINYFISLFIYKLVCVSVYSCRRGLGSVNSVQAARLL